MGLFLSITSIVGKSKNEVAESLAKYAKSAGGGMEKATLTPENDNCAVIDETNGNTTILNPHGFLEWDDASIFISKDLSAAVFSLHIHDGDLWMYMLYVNGEEVDRFNPLPDYWDDDVDQEELDSWKGSAAIVSTFVDSVKPEEIENYLVRWDLDAEETEKAYPDDKYGQEDLQLFDFMRKLKLPCPVGNDGSHTPTSETYKFWTKTLPVV